MPAPKGSKNALGNKGGGRKSAYEEFQDASFLSDLWHKEFDVEELKKKIKAGKRCGRDLFLAKLLSGQDKFLLAMFQKLVPDKRLDESNVNLSIDTENLTDLLQKIYDKDK